MKNILIGKVPLKIKTHPEIQRFRMTGHNVPTGIPAGPAGSSVYTMSLANIFLFRPLSDSINCRIFAL